MKHKKNAAISLGAESPPPVKCVVAAGFSLEQTPRLESKLELAARGLLRLERFCRANKIPCPIVNVVPSDEWHVSACAYYRKGEIRICLEDCTHPCSPAMSRNWNWPGSTVDREPYGVIAHELGHHVDVVASTNKYAYSGDYGESIMAESKEPPLTGYSPNPAEWFAEMFRLFVTNAVLLYFVRPRTYGLLLKRWKPVSSKDWIKELGSNVPERIIKSNRNKFTFAFTNYP